MYTSRLALWNSLVGGKLIFFVFIVFIINENVTILNFKRGHIQYVIICQLKKIPIGIYQILGKIAECQLRRNYTINNLIVLLLYHIICVLSIFIVKIVENYFVR